MAISSFWVISNSICSIQMCNNIDSFFTVPNMGEWYEKMKWDRCMWTNCIILVSGKCLYVSIFHCDFCITLNYFFVVTVRWHKESCGHVEYPCRFQNPAATLQRVIPYRVFAPLCLVERCEEHLLQLIPQCLSAAYSTLGTHPFSRLDVLIVPSNFSSLGMAR